MSSDVLLNRDDSVVDRGNENRMVALGLIGVGVSEGKHRLAERGSPADRSVAGPGAGECRATPRAMDGEAGGPNGLEVDGPFSVEELADVRPRVKNRRDSSAEPPHEELGTRPSARRRSDDPFGSLARTRNYLPSEPGGVSPARRVHGIIQTTGPQLFITQTG